MKSFFIKNRVFILGLLNAAILACTEIMTPGNVPSTYVLVFSLFIAVISYVARNAKGQIATIFGMIGTSLSAYFIAHPLPTNVNVQEIVKQYGFPLALAAIGILLGPNNKTLTDKS